jgi:hypothetical protein
VLPEFINTGINPASLDENGFYECYVSERFYHQFKQVHFKLGFYSKSKKSGLNFYSIFD